MCVQDLVSLVDDVQRVLNVVLGIGVFVHQLRLYLLMRKLGVNTYRWIRLAFACLGLYWAYLYIVVVVSPPANIFTSAFSSTFVLPAISLTLATIFASSIVSSKRIKP